MYLTELLNAAVLLPEEYDKDNTVVLLRSGMLPWVDEPMGVHRTDWEEVYNKYRQTEPDCEIFFSGVLSGKLDIVSKQLAALAPIRDTYVRLHEKDVDTSATQESEETISASEDIPTESEVNEEMDKGINPIMAPVMQEEMFATPFAQDDLDIGVGAAKGDSGSDMFRNMFDDETFNSECDPQVNEAALKDEEELEEPTPVEAAEVTEADTVEEECSETSQPINVVEIIRNERRVPFEHMDETAQQCATAFQNMISDYTQLFTTTSMSVVLTASNLTAEQLYYTTTRLVSDAGVFASLVGVPVDETGFINLLWEAMAQAILLCEEAQVDTAVALAKIFAGIIYEG